ncbi:hypothetical protein Geob_1729 [Geotalea daltonii FRC-32]|uniref:Uncharacterized protein n=1 Tax=Geotalea daltonii (strain DSM 22248 / JCM 15807 / FRC-32) TaxID=316067 RepID=B9M6M7_GEODF|nr:hypothetical protein [Geotalea daltonii]ACM20087.1 hypothetical protein Geob_1729 [Geotalea daltonii FRC-32]
MQMKASSEKTKPATPFTDDFQMLCALITHLGSHEKWQSRTPSEIGGSLAMPPAEVERVLAAFPCFFRESTNRKNGERLFTVHLRYARRKKDPVSGDNVSEPMTPEEIGLLMTLLTQMVSLEKQESQFVVEMRENNKSHARTVTTAIIVAVISALASLLVALLK